MHKVIGFKHNAMLQKICRLELGELRQGMRWVRIRAVEPYFSKSNKKCYAQGAYRRLYPTFADVRWIALALVVILRCV